MFRPVPGALNVVYLYGPKDDQDAMFTCPVSAIPAWVTNLVALWHSCRMMRTLPRAGGYVDQPYVVRRTFPIFEAEMASLEERNKGSSTAAMFGALMTGLVGGGRGR